MKAIKHLIFLTFAISSNLLYSQKLEKPNKVTAEDFSISNFKLPTILSYKILITFPYPEENGYGGGIDMLFSLSIKSFVRITFNKSDSYKSLFILPKIYGNGIKIDGIKYYYKKSTSIGTRKIKKSDLLNKSDSLGYFLDFSQNIQDSSVIIDLSYSFISKSKQNLIIGLDKNKLYKDFNAQIYIPEIYYYDMTAVDPSFLLSFKNDLPGPRIGFRDASGPSERLLPHVLAIQFGKEFNWKSEAVYCRENKISIKFNGSCQEVMNNSYKEIINFKLTKIVEIK
jgi:hypothetical protein